MNVSSGHQTVCADTRAYKKKTKKGKRINREKKPNRGEGEEHLEVFSLNQHSLSIF